MNLYWIEAPGKTLSSDILTYNGTDVTVVDITNEQVTLKYFSGPEEDNEFKNSDSIFKVPVKELYTEDGAILLGQSCSAGC